MSQLIPDMIAGPSVKLNRVSLQEGPLTILEHVETQFEAGGWHAILGPNGGGKSTLLKTILGLTHHSGQVAIHWPNTESHNIGYMPQLSPFDSSLPISVRDYVLMSLSTRPVWFKRALSPYIQSALEELELSKKLDRKLGDLSGGERQRLVLGIALLKKPSLLILDEPMTGLDQQGQEQCLALLSKFQQAGGTILMVEHDWEVVQQHCHNVYWIDKTLQVQSSAKDFFERYQQPSKLQPIPTT
ncbi:metal ABC transporter ATP-binding protein [Vibrio sp. THAF190c]|uniref:metal ABC transporter ATP-binding protein n=1 Tax=Vibrio sp. THAF190c TaxID=2587865 RepID=UPI001267C92E|nr:ATP-binding cassette domain-containing protein [Vibrio sp. THAF190c]QFT13097.1 High-affinity zinc uptake system ATP-binding protein ZnuC [Vibrio sp. THAF190c]